MTPAKISHSEYELHYHRLLLRRQAERRHGIILIITGALGMVYFLLTIICLLPLFFVQSTRIALVIACIAGIAISTYFVFSGVLSLRSGRRPVTSKDVYQWRHKARLALFRQARGELPPGYTFMGRMRTLLIGSSISIIGSLIMWLILSGIPELLWARDLLLAVVLLAELLLILDTLYLRVREARNLPAQSAQDLSLLFATGELTTGEIPEES
jgi:hypothetical protein